MTKQTLELMDPKTDYVFKRIFGSEQNKHVLLTFLNHILAVTGRPKLTEIILLNCYTDKDFHDEKQSIFDIKAKANDGTIIDIEMQLFNKADNEKRTLFYWSKLYSQQLKEGEKYKKLKKCIVINIVDFNVVKKTDRYHTTFHFRELTENDILFHEDAELHIIDLSKITLSDEPTTAGLKNFLLFLKYKDRLLWRRLEMNEPTIKEARHTLEVLSSDEKEREIYEARLKALRDQAAEIDSALEQGIEKGIEKGKQSKLIELVQNMLAKKLDLQLISEVTNLSIEEIEQLKITTTKE